MMTRARKPSPESGRSFSPQHNQFSSRHFAQRAEEREAPVGEPRVSFSLSDIDIFPRETVQPKMRLGPVGDRYEQGRAQHMPNRTGLPDRLKAGIESLSGIDMSDLRVHANSHKPAQINAVAYTQGNQIHLGPGQERHLPHEAWHAVQQKQGRVRATMQAKGVSINDDSKLEQEADELGYRAREIGENQTVHDLAQVVQKNPSKDQRTHTSETQLKVIQKAPWLNEKAKFKTDNGMQDIPNSEYLVEPTSYKRYAPINEIRAPGQIYLEGPRSFAYVEIDDENEKAVNETKNALPVKDNAQLIKLIDFSGRSEVYAHRIPENGLKVWDGDVSDDGNVSEWHPGHPVIELGQALPHLENEDAIRLARSQQISIHEAQKKEILPDDKKMSDMVYEWIDENFKDVEEENRDNAGLSYLANHPEIFPKLKAAKDKGAVDAAFSWLTLDVITKWLDSLPKK